METIPRECPEEEIIIDFGRLREIVPEWQRLVERSPDATPFQSPAWVVPWWEHFGTGELITPVLRRGAELAGLAPCYLHRAPDGSTRQVSFIGIGNSDYLDAVLDPEMVSEGSASILEMLILESERWDECDLFDLPSGSPLLETPVPFGFTGTREPLSTCPVLRLPDTFAAYVDSLPSVHRRKSRKERRVLEESGRLCLETANRAHLGEYLEDFFRLHQAWWNRRGEPGVLSDPAVRDFHREAAAGLMEAGWLQLYRLSLDGRPIASVYGFCRGARFYSYLGAFDPEMERFSPGVVIFLMIIEECIRNGIREFDFLRGRERYKYLWGASDTSTWRFRIRRA